MIRPNHTISQTSPTEHFALTLRVDFLGCLKVNWEADPSALRNQLPVWIGDSSAHNQCVGLVFILTPTCLLSHSSEFELHVLLSSALFWLV